MKNGRSSRPELWDDGAGVAHPMVISKGPVWRHLSIRVVLRPGETYSDSVHRRRVNQDRR